MTRIPLLMSCAVAALAAGCASAEVAPERFAESKANVRAVEAVGAAETPRAALHLKLARDQTAQARQLDAAGDAERAQLMLARANVDAQLAELLNREARSRAEADRAVQQTRSLQQQQPSEPSPQ